MAKEVKKRIKWRGVYVCMFRLLLRSDPSVRRSLWPHWIRLSLRSPKGTGWAFTGDTQCTLKLFMFSLLVNILLTTCVRVRVCRQFLKSPNFDGWFRAKHREMTDKVECLHFEAVCAAVSTTRPRSTSIGPRFSLFLKLCHCLHSFIVQDGQNFMKSSSAVKAGSSRGAIRVTAEKLKWTRVQFSGS